jgi:hypothetical protein
VGTRRDGWVTRMARLPMMLSNQLVLLDDVSHTPVFGV